MQSGKDGGLRPISRRQLIKNSLMLAGGVAVAGATSGCGLFEGPVSSSQSGKGSGSLKVASMFDLTGNLNIYGVPQLAASQLAIKAINADGGVLGRQLELISYNTKSQIDLYSRYAQDIGQSDEIPMVVGCFTGASREAARPVLSRHNKLLFFPTIDEGGECDKFTFMQGTDVLQQEGPLIDWAIENSGRRFYVVAADYIYGHVATEWTKKLLQEKGAELAGVEFVPLEVSDFASTLQRIQNAEPDVIMSNLVGANHVAFYRQLAAAGLNKEVQVVSPILGLGNEQTTLAPEEAEGIVVAYSYFESLDTPQNQPFLRDLRKANPGLEAVGDTPVQVWNAWHQWCIAVEEAGTLDIDTVVEALEAGAEYTGPSGTVQVDGPSHRNIQDVHLARVTKQRTFEIFDKFPMVKPAREVPGGETCDLTGKDANAHKMLQPEFTENG